jgi:sialate O-acetylesterase
MRKTVLSVLLMSVAFLAKADVVLPNIFAHEMVLQRGKPVAIFGKAAIGEKVKVAFENQQKETVTDANGDWKVYLDPLKANFNPQELTIKGNNTIVLKNVLVGEVWLCSGQSNMEYQMRKIVKEKAPLKGNYFPKNEVAEANNQNIRVFLVRRKYLAKPDGLYQGWSVAKDSALNQFSAPGYFFAKTLQKELNVPVGIISSAVSGSRIEPWFAAEAWETSTYLKDKKREGEPGKFYHSMIEPLAPFTLSGFIWYQGESNVFFYENISYSYKMKALIESWRSIWNDDSLSFYFTSIAPFYYSLDDKGVVRMSETILPEFREAQDLVLQLPNTGRIVTTDLVDDLKDIHPNYKWEIGRRLALQALNKTYKRNVVADGPTFSKVKFKKNTATITFKNVAKGLKSANGLPLTNFELGDNQSQICPAEAVIKKNKIVLTGDLQNITFARFAWNEVAQPNLINSEGLPAAPFRTNNPLQKYDLNKQ